MRSPPTNHLRALAAEIIRVGGGDSLGTLTSALTDAWSLGANGKEWRDLNPSPAPTPPVPPERATKRLGRMMAENAPIPGLLMGGPAPHGHRYVVKCDDSDPERRPISVRCLDCGDELVPPSPKEPHDP